MCVRCKLREGRSRMRGNLDLVSDVSSGKALLLTFLIDFRILRLQKVLVNTDGPLPFNPGCKGASITGHLGVVHHLESEAVLELVEL